MQHAFPTRITLLAWAIALGTPLMLMVSSPGWGQEYDLKDNTLLHARNGQLLMEREQFAEAIEEFKAAIRLNPFANVSAPLYNNLGLAYTKQNQFSLAYVSFQRAARLQPANALYLKNLIAAYGKAQQLLTLTHYLNQLLLENPQNAEAWFLLGLSYQQQAFTDESKPCFEQFIRLQPESPMAQAAREALK